MINLMQNQKQFNDIWGWNIEKSAKNWEHFSQRFKVTGSYIKKSVYVIYNKNPENLLSTNTTCRIESLPIFISKIETQP